MSMKMVSRHRHPRTNTLTDNRLPEGWLCPLCSSQQAGDGVVPAIPVDLAILRGLFAPPFANAAIYNIQTAEEDGQSRSTTSSGPEQPLSLAQLDGGADLPSLPFQPLKPFPLGQTPIRIPESLLSSKHAPPAEELSSYSANERMTRTSTPPLPFLPETPGSPESHEDSITSTGVWLHQPTRFQYLARFMRAGNSLNEIEKAAVELWKETSKEQLQWNEHRKSYEKTLAELANVSSSANEEVKALVDVHKSRTSQQLQGGEIPDGGETSDARVLWQQLASSPRNHPVEENSEDLGPKLESRAGLSRSLCRGKKLTAVLADVHSREGVRAQWL